MANTTEVKKIFGTALFGVVTDLVEAKEQGVKLPPLLDKVADIALDAKKSGVDMAKAEAEERAIKIVPWAVAGVLFTILAIVIIKKGL